MQTDDTDDNPAPPSSPEPHGVEFSETPLFIARWEAIGEDADSLLALQVELLDRPEAGKVIPGSGGLRKTRVPAKGHGKRGGARVIYYWRRSAFENRAPDCLRKERARRPDTPRDPPPSRTALGVASQQLSGRRFPTP